MKRGEDKPQNILNVSGLFPDFDRRRGGSDQADRRVGLGGMNGY